MAKKKKGAALRYLEYFGAVSAIQAAKLAPLPFLRWFSRMLGAAFFLAVPKRRSIAIENISKAFPGKTADEVNRLASRSAASFFLTFFEMMKFQGSLTDPAAFKRIRESVRDLEELFVKAKRLHDESNGCIFVTPHIGNWEVLPYVSAMVGIPLVVVVRPLDNPLLEKYFYANRTASGQAIIPKKNAFFVLQETLASGKSVGMLPDQSTMKGIMADFFGRKATTTPVPAILSIQNRKPIVVVACCRRPDNTYTGVVSDPIWPGEYTSEKAEINRMTAEVNAAMEKVISAFPDQYLWMHNRWKTYKGKKEFMS
ncbi:MAG: lysophospholipid acyltransferase family protein [Thermodesulfovibrionales bacterium]